MRGFAGDGDQPVLFGLDDRFRFLRQPGFLSADRGGGAFELTFLLAFGAFFGGPGAGGERFLVGGRRALELVEFCLAGFGRGFGAVGVIGEFECHRARSLAARPCRCNR